MANSKGTTEFLWKIKNGEINEMENDIEKDIQLIHTKINHRYALHHAADAGQKEIIMLLLEKGALINQKDDFEFTPLQAAVLEGHTECVKLLLEKGADKTMKTKDGQSYAECAESAAIQQLLK